ncbi:flagellar basal body rod protein FlgB [Microvirga tunisiensis]|uniref:Flagellar basal body rod protein FlgB n=2 Tax=Pannonibacter tanglangensis TaxID=2750084 RepID=A0ABW9ZLW2_9HYPH|nr:flagellar basal body rod protein FlgB [Pannonibacter sp. XCT-34]NBN79385.1 flagellar basal body rod protein FlgB [Pannonibacter sp. XCT-53]
MEPVYLTRLASQHNDWLAVRQATIAQNVANSDTPGYAARDIEPFASVFNETRLSMIATHGSHMGSAAETPEAAEVEKADTWQVSHSGNSVSLEQELMKAGEVAREHALTTTLVKSFHRMYLASLKG